MDIPFDSAEDRELIEEEAAADPVFRKRLLVTLALPDGEKRIAISAKKAIINELDQNFYPETRGLWKKLRVAVRDLMFFLGDSVRGVNLEPAVRKETVSRLSGLGDLGQFEIIGQLVTAAAGVWSSHVQASAAKQIASDQLAAQMAQIQAQESMAKAQMAIANAQMAQTGAQGQIASGVSNVVDTLTQPVAGGVPLWAVILGVFLLAKKV